VSESAAAVSAFCFDDYYLDGANRQLWFGDRPVPLNSKYLDVLLLLVSNCGRLVEKQQIFEKIWEGVFVTDAALTQCIKDIRRQLEDDATNPRYIKTVPKHGYIFIGRATAAEAGLRSAAKLGTRTIEESQAPAQPGRQLITRPYKFLDYYTEQDATLFFGREKEVELIASQVVSHRTFILHGRSGVGKSSLLRAGLVPRLSSQGHLLTVIRGFGDPLQEMYEALAQWHGGSEDIYGDFARRPLVEVARLVCNGESGRLLIFCLDQFEELFTMAAEETRHRFIDEAAALSQARDLPVRLVFAIREDALSEMSALKPGIHEIFHHEYRLQRLGREQAERAIVAPARTVGCEYDPRVVERLIVDLADDKGVDPPQLQIVCDNLYDARGPDARVTLEVYEQLGSASRILAGYLERVLHRLKAEDLRATRVVLTSLISESGQRLVVREPDLRARICGPTGLSAASAGRLTEELVAARVVRRRNYHGEPWLELAHDFLTTEISKWLTEEDVALKRARAVVERAVENSRAHGLTVGSDALDLVLPFGERLGLNAAEADLLLSSCLGRGLTVPTWLIERASNPAATVSEAAQSADANVRISAVEAAVEISSDASEELIRRAALWDSDLAVRKAASIAIARKIGSRAQDILSLPEERRKAGPIRRAVSIAMIRDHNKKLVRLGDLSWGVTALIVGGLIWVRLKRDSAEIIRNGVGGLMGGAGSGLIGGALLGIGLSFARKAAPVEAIGLILVLGSLGFFIGGLGGGGVSFGMIIASHVAYRHSRWWSVVGGALGGALIGGSSNLLGVDVVRALFGQTPAGITGSLEGAAIGAGLSLGMVLGPVLYPRRGAASSLVGGSLGAMGAGTILALVGGNLFSASLEIVGRMFANSQIRMDLLASLFGQVSFGAKAQLMLGALEGLLFGAGVSIGINSSSSTLQDTQPGETPAAAAKLEARVDRA
jgi:DNA-binding winged helix-turn-helix (wHTH) protein